MDFETQHSPEKSDLNFQKWIHSSRQQWVWWISFPVSGNNKKAKRNLDKHTNRKSYVITDIIHLNCFIGCHKKSFLTLAPALAIETLIKEMVFLLSESKINLQVDIGKYISLFIQKLPCSKIVCTRSMYYWCLCKEIKCP